MTTNHITALPDRYNNAQTIFMEARWRADLGRFTALLTGKRNMPTLSSRLAGKTVRGQHPRQLGTVEIRHIVGTESRAKDFDPNFNPLNDRVQERWVSIAAVSLNEIGLPAVELIQVGAEYFVRDGHHRVSVARALGLGFIDAWVTALEV